MLTNKAMGEEQIKTVYDEFLKEFRIDSDGFLGKFPNLKWKFATMPYIGSKYFSAKTKILFVGLDIGSDETPPKDGAPGRYQDLAERNGNIENNIGNWHIAGTYCCALNLLKEQYSWENAWQELCNYPTYHKLTKDKPRTGGENPLSFVALTNLFKFVTIGREGRTGGENRKFVDREAEELWFLREIEALKPGIVFFQTKETWRLSAETTQRIKESNITIMRAPHPAFPYMGKRPQDYIRTFEHYYGQKWIPWTTTNTPLQAKRRI
jgi:hypothetical protein